MPTYDYRCPQGHRFERFQRMSDPAAADCPECGEPAERMLSGGAGLLFKGSGFYITDYARGEAYKKAADADSGGKSAESSPKEAPAKGASSADKASGKPGPDTPTSGGKGD
jgi:putative FmdB family regulatory protein